MLTNWTCKLLLFIFVSYNSSPGNRVLVWHRTFEPLNSLFSAVMSCSPVVLCLIFSSLELHKLSTFIWAPLAHVISSGHGKELNEAVYSKFCCLHSAALDWFAFLVKNAVWIIKVKGISSFGVNCEWNCQILLQQSFGAVNYNFNLYVLLLRF